MKPTVEQPDPAAVFCAATSLLKSVYARAKLENAELGDFYNGHDQVIREVMSVATKFETWACAHVNFDELSMVWPYTLEGEFGEAVVKVLPVLALRDAKDSDFKAIADLLSLPLVKSPGVAGRSPSKKQKKISVPTADELEARIQSKQRSRTAPLR